MLIFFILLSFAQAVLIIAMYFLVRRKQDTIFFMEEDHPKEIAQLHGIYETQRASDFKTYEDLLSQNNAAWTKGQDEILDEHFAEKATWQEWTAKLTKDLTESQVRESALAAENKDILEANLELQQKVREHEEQCLPNLKLLRG